MAVKLSVNGFGKDYLIPVIGSVDFSVDAGEFVCLLGPNGCGKTTLLRIVGGIEPATRGVVLLDGQPVVADQRHERHVGVVFPHPLGPSRQTNSPFSACSETASRTGMAYRLETWQTSSLIGHSSYRTAPPLPSFPPHAAHRHRSRRRVIRSNTSLSATSMMAIMTRAHTNTIWVARISRL